MNILMNEIGMEIDEDTAISSLWIFDNILRSVKQQNDNKLDDNNNIASIGEYIEILFGCIIVYQMYIYDVYPSAHFYRLSFTQNEFWKQIMDVFFDYYVRLLFHIKDARIKTVKNIKNIKTKRTSQFVNKFINHNKQKRKSTPIQVKQSEPEQIPQKSDIEAQEEIIINHYKSNNSIAGNIEIISLSSSEDDITPTPSSNKDKSESIILTQQTYKSIQDNLKVLVKSISKSIFCKNLSPVCFIGYNLLSASRTNPVPKCISKYQRILKKIYRDRNNIIDL